MARVKSKKYTGVYKSELANGDVSFSYTYKDINNKMQRVNVGKKSEGITESYVSVKRAEAVNNVRHGEDPLASKKKKTLIFKDVWDLYVANKALSDGIRKDYQGRWNKNMAQDFTESVTLPKLISFRKRLEQLDKPLSARSIDMMIGMIGSAIRYYNAQPSNTNKLHDVVTDLRGYDRDHITKRKKNERNVKRDRFLTTEEIQMLKEEVSELHEELTLFISIALSTGARLGAIHSIKAKDISDNKVTLIDEKDGDDRYTGYLNPETLTLLTPLLSSLTPNESIFKLTKVSLQKRLQRVLNKLFNQGLHAEDRVNRVVVHTLRHTFASHLVMNSTPLMIVQKLLNHSELETTARYAHLAPDAGIDAVMELWS